MRFSFTPSAKKQAVRKLLAKACHLESLESRQLLSSYYVSTSGSDSGDGSINSPWQSVQHAVNAVDSGDVINLRAGNYAGGIRIDKPNITLQSNPGEQAFISSSPNDSSIVGTVTFGIDASGGKLLNLDISGGYYYTLKTESNWGSGDPKEYAASNILVQNTKLHGSGRDVVTIPPGSDNVSFIGDEIYDSGLRDPSNAEGIDNVNGDRMIVRDTYIHDIATTGAGQR
jgi:hypothetical protein